MSKLLLLELNYATTSDYKLPSPSRHTKAAAMTTAYKSSAERSNSPVDACINDARTIRMSKLIALRRERTPA